MAKTVTIEYHTGTNGNERDHTVEAQVCPNPECGSDNIDWGNWKCFAHRAYIECNECGLCGPDCEGVPAAVEAWNRIKFE